jgi:hypothetical protein
MTTRDNSPRGIQLLPLELPSICIRDEVVHFRLHHALAPVGSTVTVLHEGLLGTVSLYEVGYSAFVTLALYGARQPPFSVAQAHDR